MNEFATKGLDRLTLESLEDENIKPKEDYPYVWRVGNKDLSLTEIESLYRMAKLRAADFEVRNA